MGTGGTTQPTVISQVAVSFDVQNFVTTSLTVNVQVAALSFFVGQSAPPLQQQGLCHAAGETWIDLPHVPNDPAQETKVSYDLGPAQSQGSTQSPRTVPLQDDRTPGQPKPTFALAEQGVIGEVRLFIVDGDVVRDGQQRKLRVSTVCKLPDGTIYGVIRIVPTGTIALQANAVAKLTIDLPASSLTIGKVTCPAPGTSTAQAPPECADPDDVNDDASSQTRLTFELPPTLTCHGT